MNQLYTDGVEEVSITSGIVRVDLFQYVAGAKGKDGRPPREIAQRLLLSPEAFIQTYTALEQVVKQLQEKGLVQRRGDAAAAAGAAGKPPVMAPKGKSPNF
jgi:hypothetical protein